MIVKNGTSFIIKALCSHKLYGFGEQVIIKPYESNILKGPIICKQGDKISYFELPELIIFCFEKEGSISPQDEELPEDVVLITSDSSLAIKYGDLILSISHVLEEECI